MYTEKLMLAWLQSEGLEKNANYVQRGRRFSHETTERLKEDWVLAFRAFVKDVGNAQVRSLYEDIQSEIELRSEEPPYEEIAEDFEILVSKLNEMDDRMKQDPDRYDEVSEEIAEKVADFAARMENEKN